VPDGDRTAIRVPTSLSAALGITAAVVVVIGVYPQLFAHLGDLASFVR
jgi:energy-converting hydrogenase Eha subunit A